jgi:hypothetical protein
MNVDRAALDELASNLRRPPASLAAFQVLSASELRLLAGAVEATCERRQTDIDTELARAIPALPRRVIVGLLRGAGTAALRRALSGRLR